MKKRVYKHDKVVLKAYDPKVRRYFTKEKALLIKSLGKGFELHHVGSTAVAGLGGKNIPDMLLLAPDKRKANSAIKVLESIGYKINKSAGDRYRMFFNCNRKIRGKLMHMHLHLMWKTSNKYKEFLLFRDYLRKHPGEARRYFALKREWTRKAKMVRRKYTKMKENYIKEVLRKAEEEH
ncbi:MAG: GrpB family protein, partial [Candidatus Aenigmatarchaeota archaeon]